MADQKETILDAETIENKDFTGEEIQDAKNKPEKKSKLKFHLFLMLVLGVATWAFITYSQTAKDWKQQWYDFTHQPRLESTIQDTPTFKPNTTIPTSTPEQVEEPTVSAASEPVNISEDTPIFAAKDEPETITPSPEIDATSIEDLSTLLEETQQQLLTMQDNINQMFSQQFEQNKQRISAQMFAILQQAASQKEDISSSAAAWKSITLLPMLGEDRRAQAEQAWLELKGLNQDTQTLRQEVITHIQTLAEKLHPESLVEVAENVETLAETNINTDAWSSWLDWLKGQFQLRKVEQYALNLTQDPYQDLKDLISQLDKLEHALQQGYWAQLPDMDNLAHQLEQYGITTSLSSDLLEHIQQTQQTWQEQAKAWMEQL